MKISVVVKPNSKIDKAEWKENVLYVKIKAKPIQGEANEYLVKFLANYFKVSNAEVQVLVGKTNTRKIIQIGNA
ncbi:MAG: DUF167 domain-containing protein [Bacteroidota bacterium]|nr:DUF167 domain-containing protein [Bacteroidota bacterium]